MKHTEEIAQSLLTCSANSLLANFIQLLCRPFGNPPPDQLLLLAGVLAGLQCSPPQGVVAAELPVVVFQYRNIE